MLLQFVIRCKLPKNTCAVWDWRYQSRSCKEDWENPAFASHVEYLHSMVAQAEQAEVQVLTRDWPQHEVEALRHREPLASIFRKMCLTGRMVL